MPGTFYWKFWSHNGRAAIASLTALDFHCLPAQATDFQAPDKQQYIAVGTIQVPLKIGLLQVAIYPTCILCTSTTSPCERES